MKGIKTIITGLKEYIDSRKISEFQIPSTIARDANVVKSINGEKPNKKGDVQIPEQIQADLNQNDLTAKDYVKNRTHWVEISEEVIIDNQTVTIPDDLYVMNPFSFMLSSGIEYRVTWDGAEYNCTSYELSGAYVVGNPSIPKMGNDTGEPFLVVCAPDGSYRYVYGSSPGTHTITLISCVETVHKIDGKFLPEVESIGAKGTGENSEIFNSYDRNAASGNYSHAEGYNTEASSNYSHAEGENTTASGDYSHAEGKSTTASGLTSHAEGNDTTASGENSHSEGKSTTASGLTSHTEGENTTASGDYSHAEGYNTEASGKYSHAEGYNTVASDLYTHAEGEYSKATFKNAHAEGQQTTSSGWASHAEGYLSKSTGADSHSEGSYTIASGSHSHAEGASTIASGHCTHTEGGGTEASGDYSHAEGQYTIATGECQHVQGIRNIEDTNDRYTHIVGSGIYWSTRFNAHTLDWAGNAWYAGDVYVGGLSQDSGEKLLKQSDLNITKDLISLNDQVTGDTYIIQIIDGNIISRKPFSSIEIVNMPNKLEYIAGERFDPTGLIVRGVCENGNTVEIAKYAFNQTYLTEDSNHIIVLYTEGGIIYEAEIPVTVAEFDPSVILIDFEYSVNSDNTYLLTGWKETLNGVPSTEMIIPNNSKIIV